LTGYQGRALTSLQEHRRLALYCPHGVGKTTVASLALLWFAVTRDAAGIDWKIVTTAGGFRQLSAYLWPEVRLWARRLRWDLLGIEPWVHGRTVFEMGLRLRFGAALAGASDDPALLEGAHASSLMVIVDEAKSVSGATFDAVEGALSGPGEAFALAVSTPGETSGRFFEICSRRPGLTDWSVQHVSLKEAVAAGRISQAWADQRALQWGAESAVYRNRVEGEFSSGDQDSLIPLSWVEAAVERWRAWQDLGAPLPGGRLVLGCDIARFGADQTCTASRRGDHITEISRSAHEDTMATVGRIVAKLRQPTDLAVIDVIGLGSGVFDRLKEQGKQVRAFNSSAASSARDHSGELGFLNARAEGWWRLRELLDPAGASTIALPPDDELIGDLTCPKWTLNSSGKVVIESKDDLRRRLGRSTDTGDAVVMAFSERSYARAGQLQGAIPWGTQPDKGAPRAIPYASALDEPPWPWDRDEERSAEFRRRGWST
jgi:hypothetical protein